MRASSAVLAALIPLFAALVAGCDVTEPGRGAIRVTVATSGADIDPDGYRVRVDAQPGQALGINTTIIIPGLAAGRRLVRLQGNAANCLPGGENPRSIDVVADDTVTVEFAVSCASLIGSVRLSVTSSGLDIDPDGYTVQMDDGDIQTIEASSILTFENVRAGIHNITLGEVAGNCDVLSLNPAPVLVSYATRTELTIPVRCNRAPGSIRVSVSTTGDSLDVDGYTVYALLDYGYGLPRSIPVDATGAVVLDDMDVGDYSVRLMNVAGNCLINGSNPSWTTVTTRQTTEVSFAVTCTRFGNIRLRSATTGVDPDPNGYQVAMSKVDFERTDNIASNGTVTVNGLFPATYSLTLGGAAVNCEAASTNTQTATVTVGGTVDVVFDVTCAQVTQLAYWSAFAGKAQIFLVNSNGTATTPLTSTASQNLEPSWSPDGSKIAFRSNRDGNYEIYVMSVAEPAQVQRLTSNVAEDSDPAWSPDGAQIAFVSNREGSADVYVMNADGSNVVRLTTHVAYDAEPAWSPDGRKIAFVSYRAGNPEIYVMNSDGSGVTRLTTNALFDGQPAWSPDGTRIAFAREVWCDNYYYDYCQSNIHVMNADGSGITRLESEFDDSQPTWSPDGRWLAFAVQGCTYYECIAGLWAARPTGFNRTEIVNGAVGNPAWRW